MENIADVKRGLDFEMRAGKRSFPLRRAFGWWKGGKFSQKTVIFLAVIWILNFIIVMPIFGKNLTHAYSYSPYLALVSDFLRKTIHLSPSAFFSILTFMALTFAPVSFYLFVRKIAMRHEITALIAVLLFILPNPFLDNVPVLVSAILKGEGVHVLIIAFIPFFLLYVQSFISTGISTLYLVTAIGISLIAIISPFSLFNFLIFLGVLIIAEGFQGNLRIKLIRACILLFTAAALSFYWYYPTMIVGFLELSYVKFAIAKITGILPAAIPIIPVAGSLSFLIFDRREKLKSFFVSLSLFLIFLSFYWVSNLLSIGGLFSADRFLPEFMLSLSFFLTIIFIFLTELFIRNVLPKIRGRVAYFGLVVLITFGIGVVGFLTFQGVMSVHDYIQSEKIVDSYRDGVVSVRGLVNLHDISSIAASLVSLATFILLMIIIRKYPSFAGRKKQAQAQVRVQVQA